MPLRDRNRSAITLLTCPVTTPSLFLNLRLDSSLITLYFPVFHFSFWRRVR